MKKSNLYLMCGVAGSGKSTWLKEHESGFNPSHAIISRDKIRFSYLKDGDDYFAPYFMRQDFSPGMTVERISCLDPQKQGKLYCSFRADPWSVLFQLILKEYPGSYCVFDGPGGRVETLPDGAFLLLRQDESAAEAGTRFGGRLEDLGLLGCRNKLYRLMR